MRRILIILLLLLSGRAFAIDYNPDGTIKPDIDWYVDNVKAEMYEISTPNELAGLAALVNGTTGFFSPYDFTGKTVVLTNDIDMECYVDENDASVKGGVWTPIGINYSTRFAGSFDGQGYAIKNFIVAGGKSGTLFGYNSGTIRNLIIAGGMVCVEYYGAGICSHNSGTIDHCINTANVFCNNYGGGIAGKNYGDGTITNCINIGYVQNGNFCGGIVGSNANSTTTISNCVYDMQTCPLKKGCGTTDNKSIKGLPTEQIVAGLLFDQNGFVIDEKLYPRLEISTLSDALRAALSPVKLPDGQTAAGVSKNIEIIRSPGVEYSPSNTTFLEIDDSKCELKGSAPLSITIKGGNCTRYVIFKSTMQHALVTGTANSPIRISNYEDFIKFANAVNYRTSYNGIACIDGFKDVFFALSGNVHIPESVNWKPIGTPSAPFNGSFSGYGHVVTNINIMRPLEKYCGLFGYNNGTISKICLAGGHIFGGDYTGALCGYNAGTVEKCINSLPLRGHYYCGGICGFNAGGSITSSLQTNSVDGLDDYTGAICGGAIGGSISNCFFDNQMCTLPNAIGDNELLQITHTEGRPTINMIGDKLKGKGALDIEFMFSDRLYPRIISPTTYSEAIVASTPIFIDKNENTRNLMSFVKLDHTDSIKYECRQNDVLQIKDDKALPLKQGAVVLAVTDGKVKKEIMIRISNPSLAPSGTAEKPLLISSYDDLCKLSEAVNLGGNYNGYACIDGFKDVHFKITNNITCPSDGEMLPIGNMLSPFNGILDGDGKIIHSFHCVLPNLDNIGLIGYNTGTVKNIKLYGANIQGHYYTGGICGFNMGRIESCKTESSLIKADNYGGGICGFDNGEIAKCNNNSTVNCDYYAGGICGSSCGRIDTCINDRAGHTTGQSCIGGIAGSNNGEINNCTNHATIDGRDNTGGISGRNSFANITHSLNTGHINGGDCSGGIAGFNDGNIYMCINESNVVGTYAAGGIAGKGGKMVKCINKGSILSNGNNAGGIVGVTKATSEITKCYNHGTITAQAFAGGICSDNVQGNITSCISKGQLSAAYYVGGIVGYNSGNTTSCIFLGKVEGSSYFGTICGRDNDGTITRCVYDKIICNTGGIDNQDFAMKAVGYPTEQLHGNTMSIILNKDDFMYREGAYPDINQSND